MIRIAESLPQDDGPDESRGRFDDEVAPSTPALSRGRESWTAPTRWSAPSLGVWMNEEHVGFADDDCNLYRYVGNSPAQFTASDPTQI